MKKFILLLAGLFCASFIFAQTQNFKEIPVTNLPKKCTEWISKNMPKATIQKAGTASTRGTLNYLVQISVNKDKRLLRFDKDGNFIGKGDKEAKGSARKSGSMKSVGDQKTEAQPIKKTH